MRLLLSRKNLKIVEYFETKCLRTYWVSRKSIFFSISLEAADELQFLYLCSVRAYLSTVFLTCLPNLTRPVLLNWVFRKSLFYSTPLEAAD